LLLNDIEIPLALVVLYVPADCTLRITAELAVTVTVVDPTMEPIAHLIVAEPSATPLTLPDELTVATPVALLVHTQELVTFWVDESE
jgi:hypothetical protein